MGAIMFPSPDTKLNWKEPWFFKLRTYGRVAWIIRLAIFTATTGLSAVLIARESASAGGPKFGTTEKILLPILIGAFMVYLIELPTLQRFVSITEHGIDCMGAWLGTSPLLWPLAVGHWNRRELKNIELLRPREGKNRFDHPLIIVIPKYVSSAFIGVASTVPVEQIADTLHSIGIPVHLSGWSAATAEGTPKSA
jgi:hypothetical protein